MIKYLYLKLKNRRTSLFVFLFAINLGVSKAQVHIPMSMNVTVEASKKEAKVGEILEYKVVVTPVEPAGASQVAWDNIDGGFGNKQNYDTWAFATLELRLSGLAINTVGELIGGRLSYAIGNPIVKIISPNTLEVSELPLCHNTIWDDVGGGGSLEMFTPTTFTFSCVVTSSAPSAVCRPYATNLRTIRGGGTMNSDFIYSTNPGPRLDVAQTFIIPTINAQSDVSICKEASVVKTFKSSDPTKPNPAATTYTWTTSNRKGEPIKNASDNNQTGDVVEVRIVGVGLVSNTSPKSGSVQYTIVPSITTPVIDKAGNEVAVTKIEGSPVSFTITVYPVSELSSLTSAQLPEGNMLLNAQSTISSTGDFINTFNWYGPNDPTKLIEQNSDGTLNISDWQKQLTPSTYYVRVVNSYKDENGVLKTLTCPTNMLNITINPLHFTLEAVSSQVKEGNPTTFVLRLLDSDGKPQGFNKDEIVTIKLRDDNEAKPGHYQIQSTIAFNRMVTQVEIPIKTFYDNIVYNTEVLKITAGCEDLRYADADLTILDATSDDPKNTIITLEDGIIYTNEPLTLQAKLPAGIVAGRDIKFGLIKDDVKSDISMLLSEPYFPATVIIKSNTSSAQYTVKSEINNSAVPAQLFLQGLATGFQFKEGRVIILNQTIQIPNVFSPNQDGLNDVWVIKSIDKYPSFTLKLYNEWGSEIFSTNASNYKEFDGSYNGKQLQHGECFYYIIDLHDNKHKPYVGRVAVIRPSASIE